MKQLVLKYIGAMRPRTHAVLSIAFMILGLVLMYAVVQFQSRWAGYFSAFAFCGAGVEFLFFAVSKSGQYSMELSDASASSPTDSFSWWRATSFVFAGIFFISMIGSQLAGAAISAIFYGIACLASWAPAGKKRWYSLSAKYALVSAATVLALYCQPDTMNFNQ